MLRHAAVDVAVLFCIVWLYALIHTGVYVYTCILYSGLVVGRRYGCMYRYR